MSELGELTWDSTDLQPYNEALSRDQKYESDVYFGERFAMVVNCDTKADLEKRIRKALDADEDGDAAVGFVDYMVAAEKSLETRLKLVTTAIARFTVAVEALAARK